VQSLAGFLYVAQRSDATITNSEIRNTFGLVGTFAFIEADSQLVLEHTKIHSMTTDNPNSEYPKIISCNYAQQLILTNTTITESSIQAINSVSTDMILRDSSFTQMEAQQNQAIVKATLGSSISLDRLVITQTENASSAEFAKGLHVEDIE
jgi:hypothetical protein